ncbi:MAG: hypothetical protein ACI9RL_001170 [Candidatus Paceibacteria bacterium]|jgi:hypothetical protein
MRWLILQFFYPPVINNLIVENLKILLISIKKI